MSDKWETVVAAKRKPKPPPSAPQNGQAVPVGASSTSTQSQNKKSGKPKKYSAKTPVSFPLAEDYVDEAPAVVSVKADPKKSNKQKSDKKKNGSTEKSSKEKRRDLQSSLANLSHSDLLAFFRELQNASGGGDGRGGAGDVSLSWIKYSADALNTKLVNVIPPDPSQWPLDLNYPSLPSKLEETLRTIISETAATRKDVDILGVSFASLLAFIPTLIQRGDAGWGYLLYLRELLRLDPSLAIRRERSFNELMESYGNRKEIGIAVLWVMSQAAVERNSPLVLKIASSYLLPYYGFKNYKQFVLSALKNISGGNMAPEPQIEAEEFNLFFEAAFDPKKKRDLDDIYPKVKELVFRRLHGQGVSIFLNFLQKTSETDFAPHSAYGKEVFDILTNCLEKESTCIVTWRDNLLKFPKESLTLVNHLSKIPDSLSCGKALESQLIQSDEFAVAAVKNPELLRVAKKLQRRLEEVALARKKFSMWKVASLIVICLIGGLFYLDVTENGKGYFEKSNTGLLLKKYGVLNQVQFALKTLREGFRYIQEWATLLFRSIYKVLQPMLQTVIAQVQSYIPQLNEYLTIIWNFFYEFLTNFVKFMEEKVFVGALSPESLRKVTKDSLSFIWSNILVAFDSLYKLIQKYVS